MGQNHSSNANPLLQDWGKHPYEPNIFMNGKTGQQVQLHSAVLRKSEQIIMRKRMQQSHNFIIRILYFQPAEQTKVAKEEMKFNVYTERLARLSHDVWIPINSALSILKGFRRLSSSYGPMRVTGNMIKVDPKKEIRVWINQSPIKNQVSFSADSEKQMIADIAKIVSELDHKLGHLLANSNSFNDAINSIIHSMASLNISHSNASSKVAKNEEKPSFLVASAGNKNNFRSTKETQDNQIKPIAENEISKEISKKDIIVNLQSKTQTNYLHNIHVPKPPVYIDAFGNDSKSQISISGHRKVINEGNMVSEKVNYNNYSHQVNAQRPNLAQLNVSQPEKVIPPRTFKPIEYKNLNEGYSYAANGQLTPSYSRSHKEADKFKEILHRQPTRPAQDFEMKSSPIEYRPIESKTMTLFRSEKRDVYQQEMQKREHSNVNRSSQNQKSEVNTSREYLESHPLQARRHQVPNASTSNVNQHRTKTQQFYLHNMKNDSGYSPRFKTNYLPTTTGVEMETQKPSISQSQIHMQGKRNAVNASSTPNKSRPIQQNEESKNDQMKKFHKIKQAQRIKQEMSCLGLENTNSSKLLANDKSARDLLIKKKVEQKNKKHEDLKFAISKLLKQ